MHGANKVYNYVSSTKWYILPKTFELSWWGKGKLNVNFLSILFGNLIKNVQMKSYDFIINKC